MNHGSALPYKNQCEAGKGFGYKKKHPNAKSYVCSLGCSVLLFRAVQYSVLTACVESMDLDEVWIGFTDFYLFDQTHHTSLSGLTY